MHVETTVRYKIQRETLSKAGDSSDLSSSWEISVIINDNHPSSPRYRGKKAS